MVICPIALAIHCYGCPIVKICPAKRILGDYDKVQRPAEKNEDETKDTKDQP